MRIFDFHAKEDAIAHYRRCPSIVISANAEALLSQDQRFLNIIEQHGSYADGVGALYYLRMQGVRGCIKIPGVELWLDFLQGSSGSRVFLIGCSQRVIDLVAKKFKQDFPGHLLVGWRDGFVDEHAWGHVTDQIVALSPDVVVVAMGQPRQEFFASLLYEKRSMHIFCVGGALDVYSGYVKRAPRWLIALHLEWFYRLLIQPSRFVRYLRLLQLFPFLWGTFWRRR